MCGEHRKDRKSDKDMIHMSERMNEAMGQSTMSNCVCW